MKKRILWSASAMIMLLLVGYFLPHVYWLIRGSVDGEAFYAGKPSSYWRELAKKAPPESTWMELAWSVPNTPPSPTIYADDFEIEDLVLQPIPAYYFSSTSFVMAEPTWGDKIDQWKQNWFGSGEGRWDDLKTDPDAIPVLRDLLRDADETVRDNAVVALCQHGKEISDDVPALLEYVRKGGSARAKNAIAEVLPEIGGDELLPTMCAWLNESDEQADFACRVIRNHPKKKNAIPLLMRNLGRERGEHSAGALAWIGHDALPDLTKELRSENVVVRRHATHAVAHMQKPALPLLITQMKDADAKVRCEALFPLGHREATPDAKCALLRAYNDDADAEVSQAALASLRRATSRYTQAEPRRTLERWLAAAERENQADLHFEAGRALEKYLRSK